MGLLHDFAGHILVPEPVATEIRKKGDDDITARALHTTSWLKIVPVSTTPDVIVEWGLGKGESSVLAYAYRHPGAEAIIDDLAGRKCAASLHIPVRGTLGIVLAAKKRGIIPQARPVLENLIRSGLYLSKPILNEALKRVGE